MGTPPLPPTALPPLPLTILGGAHKAQLERCDARLEHVDLALLRNALRLLRRQHHPELAAVDIRGVHRLAIGHEVVARVARRHRHLLAAVAQVVQLLAENHRHAPAAAHAHGSHRAGGAEVRQSGELRRDARRGAVGGAA